MSRKKEDNNPAAMNRRRFLQASAVGSAFTLMSPLLSRAAEHGLPFSERGARAFELDEATVAELQAGMQEGRLTARSITEKYLARIAEIDRRGPALNSVIE